MSISRDYKNLAINPLMLTLLALLQQSGRTLPHRRIELYQIVTPTLLDNWNQQTGRRVFPPDEIALAEEMLSYLAYAMHSSDLLLTEVKVKEIACQTMTAFYKGAPTDEKVTQFIDTIRQSSGLFVEGGQGLFCFMHRTFQEYYVAQYLMPQPDDWLQDFIQQHCHHAIWHEPFLLLIAEKSTQKSQQACNLIQAILDTKKSYDTVLQRHVLLAASCVIDCNVWRIEPALQRTIACQLLELYGDTDGAGRYAPLQQEIQRLARLWLRGQPAESSSSLPSLLATWHDALCDTTLAVRQAGAVRLLSDLALDLPDCPKLVLSSLLPPLVTLARLPELPDFPLPAEIRNQCALLPAIRPISMHITEYALVTLRLLDADGPAGWLHRAWLTWSEKQPELLEHLSQHALALDYLLTPAAFPATWDDEHWSEQLALGQKWQKLARSNPKALQTRMLQASMAARFPHSYLYWQMLRQETTQNIQGQSWKANWQSFLHQEMDHGHIATYQTCFNLRLLFCQQDKQQLQAIANEITVALSSQDQQQTMVLITLTNRYLRNLRNHKEIAMILCSMLNQGNASSSTTLLLTLYSLIISNQQILTELQQPVEQALQQFESMAASQQQTLVREQKQLIKAIRQQLHPVTSTQPTSQFVGSKTPEERATQLDALKQRVTLSKQDMEELLDACTDTREITAEIWQNLTQGTVGWGTGSVGYLAWRQLSHPFMLSDEAWIVLLSALESLDPLLCGAATQVFQASKHVPQLARVQATQIMLHILSDETLSYRSLDTPDGRFLRLDDKLFQTLQTLAEQEEICSFRWTGN